MFSALAQSGWALSTRGCIGRGIDDAPLLSLAIHSSSVLAFCYRCFLTRLHSVLSIIARDRGFQRPRLAPIDILHTHCGIVIATSAVSISYSVPFLHAVSGDAYVFLIASDCLVNVAGHGGHGAI
jgi:hypothetical protein